MLNAQSHEQRARRFQQPEAGEETAVGKVDGMESVRDMGRRHDAQDRKTYMGKGLTDLQDYMDRSQ